MQNFPAFNSPFTPGFMSIFLPFMLLLAVWTIAIKGYALWTSARSEQKWWFIALLVINTVGILEVIYLIWYSPKGSNKLNKGSQTPAVPSSSPQV